MTEPGPTGPPAPADLERESYLRLAARLAWRGHGGAEPNPMVGCVIVSPAGTIVGWGYHRRCGGPHAEIEALRRAGAAARGAVVYVTLEPCNHAGRTGPCAQALIDAGVDCVVIAREDPNPPAAGGASALRDAGIDVVCCCGCREAVAVSDPFVHRVRTGLPWVVAKWAQTLDGRIATRTGESQWISGVASRRLVHRERGRVDAILTGIGTVLADDPLLTAREVRVRRIARRVVVDPDLRLPPDSRLATTADEVPTLVACAGDAIEQRSGAAALLRERGVEIVGLPSDAADVPLDALLRELVRRHDVTNVLVEGGAGLLGRLFRANLVQESWVFLAPLLLGDDEAMTGVRGLETPRLADATRLALRSVRRRGDDLVLRYGAGGRSP
ncbi:MAG: bifunctional diaminohydroxyphosphoribosylaminopyrimidine deaminase/5-amino-6-(5-phosphoribosylamino)uracil reductase RibD [Planctomycetota bacterium]